MHPHFLRYTFTVPVLAAVMVSNAQMPSLKVEGKDSARVYLQQLGIEVVIDGGIATTTWTLTFRNSTNRILEGELNFPLPDGVSISQYALDINGRMREAVPVEKEKATLVFESTERRRVDPGVLEKVDGNTFRTRIYPINPGGTRTVRIGYQQELSRESESDLRYRLPLAFRSPIADVSIRISVPGTAAKPRFDENTRDALQFDDWKQVWTASRQWKNYAADEPISIRIPEPPGSNVVLMQPEGNHYVYAASVFPVKQERIEKKRPARVTLLWDAGLNGLYRDHKKEFDLLNAYFARLGDVEADLVEFSNEIRESKQYSIRKGDWSQLKKELENVVYDGGTQFGILNLPACKGEELLLFSDGHSSFGSDQIVLGDRPVYAVVAAAGADFPYLHSLTGRTGGEVLDLNAMSVAGAGDQLRWLTLQFMGVKPTDGLEESYPSIDVPVTGEITVTGICYKPSGPVVLQYGYGGKVLSRQTLNLDFSRQQTTQVDVARLWAQKKIAELDMRFEDNKEEIRRIGRRYGLVTRNTSLVVLENVMDYVVNEIEPPAELREEYDRILKGRQGGALQSRRTAMDNAEQYFNELLEWWKGGRETVEKGKDDNGTGTAQEERLMADSTRAPAPPGEMSRYSAPRIVEDRAYRQAPVAGQAIVGSTYGVARRSTRNSSAQYQSTDKDADAPPPPPTKGTFTILKPETSTRYLGQLKAAAPAERYTVYLQLRKDYLHVPLFYFHVAEFFLASGEKALGLRILSNIAALDAENYELFKLMAYKLKETGQTEAACITFRKVLEWRPFEPQSYRDYGLALEDAGRYQQALDTLYLALTRNYNADIEAQYPGFEETLVPEINELVSRHGKGLDISRVPKQLIAAMPVDMRVVLNWNLNNTDIDLWVTDPDNERCFYGHPSTEMGGRISHDFTQGLGPEQFLLKKAAKGRYKVEVNYYGDTQVRLAGETTVLVEVYTNYGMPQQQRRLVTLQLKKGGSGAVYVGDFEFD
jgi:tetratricopeptide (TPR) repeat protein